MKAVRVADRLPWRELYEAHAADLASYLLRLVGDREVASDLMQETFVLGMRDENALREPANDIEVIAVREALRAISPEQAVALVLHYAQGFTRGEIAELTGRSDEAIKSRIARGRRAFLAVYGRRGGKE